MHGEYKVPGGKLVVVDLDEEGGRIAELPTGRRLLPRARHRARRHRRGRQRPARSTSMRLGSPRRSARRCPTTPCCSASRPRPSRPRSGASIGNATSWRDYDWQIVHDPAVSPGDAPRPRRGAHRGGRRGAPRADAADLGVGPIGRRDRQLPVAAQRGRPRERREVRLRGRAPHQRRRRDVHGGRLGRHLLALRARRPRARA